MPVIKFLLLAFSPVNWKPIKWHLLYDNGEGVQFHVYVYNVQPGVEIDYATGESKAAETGAADSSVQEQYVLNTNKPFY